MPRRDAIGRASSNPGRSGHCEPVTRTWQRRRASGCRFTSSMPATASEIERAFATFARERPARLSSAADAVLHQPSVISSSRWRRGTRCPRSIRSRDFVDAGGLMSYGARLVDAVSPGRRLRRSHPQGREAGRPAGACSRPSSNWSSISRPPRRSASTCRRRCSPAPTR